jgi:hypothetical protein
LLNCVCMHFSHRAHASASPSLPLLLLPSACPGRRHNQTFLRQWVDKHVEDCDALLKKPCLVEEFGKTMGRWVGSLCLLCPLHPPLATCLCLLNPSRTVPHPSLPAAPLSCPGLQGPEPAPRAGRPEAGPRVRWTVRSSRDGHWAAAGAGGLPVLALGLQCVPQRSPRTLW